jgi:hypothetical protein
MDVDDDELMLVYHLLAYCYYYRAIGEMILRVDLER